LRFSFCLFSIHASRREEATFGTIGSLIPLCGGMWWILQKIKKSLDEKKKICSGEKFYKKAKNHHNPPHRTSIACL